MTGPAEIESALGLTETSLSPSTKLAFAKRKAQRSSPKLKEKSLWSSAEETFEMTFKVLFPSVGV